MKTGWAIASGLIIAALGQFFALLLAGAGHGWTSPFWASIVFWVVYPLALLRRSQKRPAIGVDVLLVLVAPLSDLYLVQQTSREGFDYLWNMARLGAGPLIALWGVIWIGWQIIALITLAKSMSADRTSRR
jgi:hypothetical protein